MSVFGTLLIVSRLFWIGPVAQSGLRRRPSEPENGGSNPLGPATIRGQVPRSLNPFRCLSAQYAAYGVFRVFENVHGMLIHFVKLFFLLHSSDRRPKFGA